MNEATDAKPKKVKLPSLSNQYQQLADTYLNVGTCRDCGGLIYRGYCCMWCDSTNP